MATETGMQQAELPTKAIQGLVSSTEGPLLEFLKASNIDLKSTFKVGKTVLFYACEFGKKHVVQQLLEGGADVYHQDESFAAERGQADIVQLLLDYTIIVDTLDKAHNTPLLMAAKGGHEKVVGMLIASGADVNIRDKNGWTPLCWVVYNGFLQVAEQLLKAGAHCNNQEPAQGKAMKSLLRYYKAEPTWLRCHLAAQNLSCAQVLKCENKLVYKEGFTTEELFASIHPSQFNAAYLGSLGITGMGVTQLLLRLHLRLHQEYRRCAEHANVVSVGAMPPDGVTAIKVESPG